MSDEPASGTTAVVNHPDEQTPHGKTRTILSILVVVGFFLFIGAATFWRAVDQQIALIAVAYVSGAATMVLGFYFGSSVSSDAQRDTISKQLNKKQTEPTS